MSADDPSAEPVDASAGRWSVPVGAILLAAAGAIALGFATVTASDAPGRVFTGVAALVLTGAAVFGTLARPRLTADIDGLVIRGVFRAAVLPWSQVDAVRVARARRLGLPVAFVEIEARDLDNEEHLLMFGRLELGDDPVDVAAALQEHRASAGRRDRSEPSPD